MRVLGKPIEHEYTLFDLLRRPEVSYAALMTLPGVPAKRRMHRPAGRRAGGDLRPSIRATSTVRPDEVARIRRQREHGLPADLDYAQVAGLSNEVKQKLAQHRPQTIGQASRIQGMTPAAISLLLIHLKRCNLSQAA